MPFEKTTKKLLFVITKSNWGGAQKYVYDLAIHTKNKYETAVVVGGTGILKQKLEDENVRTISIPLFSRNVSIIRDPLVFFQLLELFKKERPDIVHLNSSKVGFIGTLAARFAKVPRIVFTAHGWAFNEKRNWLSKKLFYFLHWLTVIFSHETILVSRALAKDMRHAPFIKGKLTVVHNGVEDFPIKTRDEARSVLFSSKSPMPPNTFWIGAVAELHNNKGLSYAVRAIKKLKDASPNLHFLFVVIGEGEGRKHLEKLIFELGLHENVFLAGYREDAASFLSAFDVFLSSSITEALAFVVLEAGMARLPVIASAVGGVPEIIEDMKSGILIRSKNPEEIAKAFDFLLSHKKEAETFGKKLCANVKKNFSFKKMLCETIAVYDKE